MVFQHNSLIDSARAPQQWNQYYKAKAIQYHTSAAPGRCIHCLGKIHHEKSHFHFRTLLKWFFSTLSIFPNGFGAYLDGIFDQKIIHPIFPEIIDFKVGGYGPKVGAVISEPKWLQPYTHCIDRGNKHFQIMQKIFTCLENAFVGTGWPWKPHKSKVHNFLHRNYTPKIFSTPKKIRQFFDRTFFSEFFSTKNFPRKIQPKIENFRFSPKVFF